jgi:hypothetical protein
LCQDGRTVFIRDCWKDLEAAAQSYEADDGIIVKMSKCPLISDPFLVVDPSYKSGEIPAEECSSLQLENLNGNKFPEREPSADCKQCEDECESDSEAFMVKRRRVLPLSRKRFQVDEQGLTPEKSAV